MARDYKSRGVTFFSRGSKLVLCIQYPDQLILHAFVPLFTGASTWFSTWMSSVLNHVPSYSGIRPLGVAQLLDCRLRRGATYYPTLFTLSRAASCNRTRLAAFATFGNPPTAETELPGSQQNRRCEQDACDTFCGIRPRSGKDNCDVHDLDQESQSLHSSPKRKRPFKPAAPTKYLSLAIQNAGYNTDGAGRPKYSIVRRELKRSRNNSVNKELGCRLSFQVIVGNYLQYVEPVLTQKHGPRIDQKSLASFQLDNALKVAFPTEHVQYLEKRGYEITDVVAWAWILRSNSTYQAILRIFALEEDYRAKRRPAGRGVPPFIPLFLMRQSVVDARTFRLLAIYCLHLISGQPLPSLYSGKVAAWYEAVSDVPRSHQYAKSTMEPTTCMSLVVRLLRHARRVWPQAQLPIARAFAQYLNNLGIDEKNTSKRKTLAEATSIRNQLKTQMFNKFLWLLSLRSKPNPFIFVPVQQRAQFETLKAMATHEPVILVERRGYQGITAVQLAHKKTSAEKQSAELKAPSWPPWKEDKLGIDSERGIDGMESRAMQVMAQMVGAGYSHTRWEQVASVLAGWDTDRSPTIQTRAFMCRSQSLRGRGPSAPDQEVIWAARIRATRTVREAWACFLSYQNHGFLPRPSIYAAMAEKLIYRRRAVENRFDETTHALPGDCPEVFPEPTSARDVIYVRTEPPALDEFLGQMLTQGIRPSGRFLALLLRSAPTFNSGLNYLRCSDLPPDQIKALCSISYQTSLDTFKGIRVLRRLPDYIFAAFIRFLCNSSNFDALYRAGHDVSTADIFPVAMGDVGSTRLKVTTLFQHAEASTMGEDIPHPRTLCHAVELMRMRRTTYTPAWTSLLSCLSRNRINSMMDRSLQHILAWHEILEIFEWMDELQVDSGFREFLYLCRSFSTAVVAGIVQSDSAERGLAMMKRARGDPQMSDPKHIYATFEDMVHDGLDVLKRHFDKLVLPDPHLDVTNGVPGLPMLHVPFPAALHAFIRALGVAEDCDGLLNLLRWMRQHAATLKEVSDEMSNGERMTRRCLVAVRVFLEGSWTRQRWSPVVIDQTWSFPFKHGYTSKNTARNNRPHDGALIFSDPIVQESYNIIEATPEWGSWPTNEEVQEYMYGYGEEVLA